MKLNRIEIKNFKSIEDVTVTFDPRCRVLAGINESGKSNILHALALLSPAYKPNAQTQKREPLPDEGPIKESYVRFVFTLDKVEAESIFERVLEKIVSATKNPETVICGDRVQSLKTFCGNQSEALFVINILKETKSCSCWTLAGHKLTPGWKKLTSDAPTGFSMEFMGDEFVIPDGALVRASDFPNIPESYLEDATFDDLISVVATEIKETTQNALPEVLFWVYDEANLLPNSVNIAQFSANPNACVPLKNMFALDGIDNIRDSLAEQKLASINQFQNYLDRIAKKTTDHFRNVWKEYKHIEFSLRLNSDQIIPGIRERNTHDFARRSDGFKRFVTFLLMISVNVKTDRLRNTLLIIDEPEASLHPAGARYLREELIRISKTNHVVYSTHSIFMIDSGDVGRHYIVKKKNEVTSIEPAGDSNVADEEVLYNALGHSVFSILKQQNVIFEGWKDKRLFQVAISAASTELKRRYRDIGLCHARGAKSIKTITPMIELAKRSCVIVSDSDKPAKEQQRSYKQEKGYGEWKTYQDIVSDLAALTGEDFIKNDFIAEKINAVMQAIESMPLFVEATLPIAHGKLSAILKWLEENGMSAEQAKDTAAEIKNALFEDLKPRNIDPAYTKLMQGLLEIIESSQKQSRG